MKTLVPDSLLIDEKDGVYGERIPVGSKRFAVNFRVLRREQDRHVANHEDRYRWEGLV